MAQRLRVKRIETVGFVDKGDNPKAFVAFWKRATEDDMTKPFDPTTLTGDAKVAWDALEKRATEAEAAIEKAKPSDPPKPELPEAIQKQLEDAEKRAKDAEERITKVETDRRREVAIRKVEGWKHLPVKPEEFGEIVRKIEDGVKLTADELKELDRVLGAANEGVRVGKLFGEIGNDTPAEGSAVARVDAKVSEIRKADPKVTVEAARAQVYRENPSLAREIEDEDRQRAAAR